MRSQFIHRALLRPRSLLIARILDAASFHSFPLRQCSCTEPKQRQTLNPTTIDPPIPPADHRQLASKLDLFSTTPYSPGTPLLHPDGSHIFLKLQAFLRAQYGAYGFREVVSPTIYKQSLWEKSGHWENYKDDMFEVSGNATGKGGRSANKQIGEEQKYGLKPMNCPGHCLLYKTKKRSWRDLPIRYADFSPLHRNEISGSLSGLTRVRRFHQDDGHIFCRPDQVGEEIAKSLEMVGAIYGVFGLAPYKLVLSTKPKEQYIGEIRQWDTAEAQLTEALNAAGRAWEVNEGDGAFYGPKIDIILKDTDGKLHQTATIQLDFQLPERFELTYDTAEGGTATGVDARPVMIHRAVLGSLERFMALLIEHCKGHWPFWLSPRQLVILTTNDAPETLAYARWVEETLNSAELNKESGLYPMSASSFQVSRDTRAMPLSAKVAQAKADHFNLISVVGPKDMANGTISVDYSRQPGFVDGWDDACNSGGGEALASKRQNKQMTPQDLLKTMTRISRLYS